MDEARKAGHLYFLRFCLVGFALPCLPAAGGYLAIAVGLGEYVAFGIGVLMLGVWALLARRLLAKFTTRCPHCGRPNATIQSIEQVAFLVCPDCGWKKEIGYDLKDPGG
jgi:DNA-directed RNA polymerase subunit RPC12/RpoP